MWLQLLGSPRDGAIYDNCWLNFHRNVCQPKTGKNDICNRWGNIMFLGPLDGSRDSFHENNKNTDNATLNPSTYLRNWTWTVGYKVENSHWTIQNLRSMDDMSSIWVFFTNKIRKYINHVNNWQARQSWKTWCPLSTTLWIVVCLSLSFLDPSMPLERTKKTVYRIPSNTAY